MRQVCYKMCWWSNKGSWLRNLPSGNQITKTVLIVDTKESIMRKTKENFWQRRYTSTLHA